MLADVYLMVTNVYPMVAEESSVANIKKVAKIDDKIRKIEQPWVGNTALDLKQPMNYPIPRSYWIPSVQSATICYPSVSIVGIGGGPDAFLVTDNKVSIGNPMSSVPGPNVQIESYHYQLPSVTECPRLTYNLYIFGKHYLNGIDNVQNFGISKLPKPIPKVKFRPILKLIVSLITQKQTNI